MSAWTLEREAALEAALREHEERGRRSLDYPAWEVADLLAEVRRLRALVPDDRLRGSAPDDQRGLYRAEILALFDLSQFPGVDVNKPPIGDLADNPAFAEARRLVQAEMDRYERKDARPARSTT